MNPVYKLAIWSTIIWFILYLLIRYTPLFTRVDGWVKRRVKYDEMLFKIQNKQPVAKQNKSDKSDSLSSKIRERQGR